MQRRWVIFPLQHMATQMRCQSSVHMDGYPFLVDPGTYAYHTHAEWRKYFVSTLAHNTVTINNADQASIVRSNIMAQSL